MPSEAGGWTGATDPGSDGRASEPGSAAGPIAPAAPAPLPEVSPEVPSEVPQGAVDEAAARAGDREAGPSEQRLASSGCTLSQLRRFVKSRPYVPLHELRRRFALNGNEDDVVPLAAGGERLFVGLPEREARLLEELLMHGEVGYECSLDPPSPIIVGVYPMRPVPRQ